MVQVVGVDVRDQRDSRVVEKERAVGLVCFDDEQIVSTGAAGDTEIGNDSPVDETRVGTERTQRRDDHPRRGRLAVRSRNRDQRAAADQPVERLRAMDDGQSPFLRRDELRVFGPDRPGVDDSVGTLQMRGVVPDVDTRSSGSEGLECRTVGAVGSRDADAAIQEHARQARHPRAADTDEVRCLDGLGDREAEVGSDHDPTILGRRR